MLHYHLAMWQSVADFVIEGQSPFWGNDLSTVTTNETWFWHDAGGTTSADRVASTNDGKLLMNVSNAGFRSYWATSLAAQAAASECDGVFLDSAAVSLFTGETSDPQLAGTAAANTVFSQLGGATWSQAWESWIQALDASLGAGGLVLIPNVGPLVTTWDHTNYGLPSGQFLEGFCDPSFSTTDWKAAMNQTIGFVNAGHVVMLQNYLNGNPGDLARRRYFLANYLLVKGAKTYLDYFASAPLEWYPEWKLDLGAPVTSAVSGIDDLKQASGVYRRDFANGFVLVNPTGSPITATFSGTHGRVVPSGGGAVPSNGAEPGSYSTSSVTSSIVVPAGGAEIILN
jgi:hypothetical protein